MFKHFKKVTFLIIIAVYTLALSTNFAGAASLNDATQKEFKDRGINIKWYGAKGNGVADDTTAFERVLTAVGANDADLYIPKGTYKITRNITIPVNISVSLAKGAIFSVETGATLTISDDIKSGTVEKMGEGNIVYADIRKYVGSVESCLTNIKLQVGDVITAKRFFNDSEIIDASYKVVQHDANDEWTNFYNGIQYNQNGEFNIGNGRKLYNINAGGVNVRHFGASCQSEKYNDTSGLQCALNFIAYKEIKEQTSSTTGYKIYIPSGFYRVTQPLIVKSQRTSIAGDGFNSILSADEGVPILIDLQVPRPLSSTFTMHDVMLINADVLLNSSTITVDSNIHHCWFGQSKTHIKGSFVTLNLCNNILELAEEGSIYCDSVGGFRKANINDNNFFGNSNYHIQLIGVSTDKSLLSNININDNVFDQVNQSVADNSNSGGVRIVYGSNINITNNLFNGKGSTYKSSCVRVLNSENIEVDNIYSYCESDCVYVTDSKNVSLKGKVSNSTRGVLSARNNHVKVDMDIVNTTGISVAIDNCNYFDVKGHISNSAQTGVYIIASTDGLLNNLTIEGCNTSNTASYGGIVIASPTAISQRILLNNCISTNNLQSNIKVYNGCKNIVIKENSLGTDALSTIVDLGGTNIIISNNYSFSE